MAHPHSYHPVGVDIPNYVPNEWSTLALVSTFAAVAVAVLATAKTLAAKSNPNISIPDLSTVLWFSLCTSHLYTQNLVLITLQTCDVVLIVIRLPHPLRPRGLLRLQLHHPPGLAAHPRPALERILPI